MVAKKKAVTKKKAAKKKAATEEGMEHAWSTLEDRLGLSSGSALEQPLRDELATPHKPRPTAEEGVPDLSAEPEPEPEPEQ